MLRCGSTNWDYFGLKKAPKPRNLESLEIFRRLNHSRLEEMNRFGALTLDSDSSESEEVIKSV